MVRNKGHDSHNMYVYKYPPLSVPLQKLIKQSSTMTTPKIPWKSDSVPGLVMEVTMHLPQDLGDSYQKVDGRMGAGSLLDELGFVINFTVVKWPQTEVIFKLYREIQNRSYYKRNLLDPRDFQ